MQIPDKPNLTLAKKLSIVAWILSVIVLLLVGLMRRVKLDIDADLSVLPSFNAVVNTITAIVLIIAYYFIRTKRVTLHRRMIYVALSLSVIFLLSYVLYHFTTPETRYCGEGWTRPVYFVLLISHVVLAAAVFPFVLFTFVRGYTGQYRRHKRMARWIFPIWLYVAITGPVVYLMLSPCYGN